LVIFVLPQQLTLTLAGLRDEIKPQDGYHGGILHCRLLAHILPYQVGARPFWHRLVSKQLRVAACDGVYCLIVCPHFPHLMTRALVLKRKESLHHLISQCLLLHGWVTLEGGYAVGAAFLYQIVWIFLFIICALSFLGIRMYGGICQGC
jgi:hypothetical protein